MERRDERRAGEDERRSTDRGRHRLVQMEHVETLALEHAADPAEGTGREDDVRQRAVRRHDDRAPHRYDVRRRLVVAPDARVQHARELPRRVVAHDEPYVVAERLERGRL